MIVLSLHQVLSSHRLARLLVEPFAAIVLDLGLIALGVLGTFRHSARDL